MDIDEINIEWANDVDIFENSVDLLGENKKIQKLHHKYYTIFLDYSKKIIKLKYDYKKLEKLKYDYYSGSMSLSEIKQLGWDTQPLKILKTDVKRYVESDDDIIILLTKISALELTAKYLEDIIRKVSERSFIIKNQIEIMKFQAGVI